jgi:broad specificity phosphatase PhoE
MAALAARHEASANDDTLLVVAHDAVNRVLLCKVLGCRCRAVDVPPGADHAQPARRPPTSTTSTSCA